MSRIVVIILIYHRHNHIDTLNILNYYLLKTLPVAHITHRRVGQ
jgi:hypothetical protein